MTRRTGATQEGLRRQNLGTLVRILHEDGPATRSDLSTATGLNRSTVGALAAELAALDVVREGKGESAGVGRPSIRVEPRPDRVAVLAADLRVGEIEVALVGLGGTVLARRTATVAPGRSPQSWADRVVRLATKVRAEADPSLTCIGLGVGVPGLVRHDDNVVRTAPNLGWTDVPLGALLSRRLDVEIPVWVGNDADLGALAEHRRGAARGSSHAIYLAGEVGVGGGVIVANRMLSGAGGYGGEVGHMRVNPHGHGCRCGAQGCWETEIGQPALLRAAGLDEEGHTVHEVVERAQAGDSRSRDALVGVAHWIGVGVANLVNLLNPEVVVFGGTLREILPAVRDEVERGVHGALLAAREGLRLEVAALGGDSTLIGAAEIAFEPVLADPLGVLAPPTLPERASARAATGS